MNNAKLLTMMALVGWLHPVAQADQLILADGRVLTGAVTRSRDAYALTMPNGNQLTLPAADVKRAKYVSRVAPADAVAMMAELIQLVAPAFDAPEPDQFVFLTESTTYADEATFDSAAVRFNARSARITGRRTSVRLRDRDRSVNLFSAVQGASGEVMSTVQRDQVSDNVFVDEWLRYAAGFEAIAADTRYRELTNMRRQANALGDFACRAPQAYRGAADAVRAALRALDDCLELAAETQLRIEALPLRDLGHEREIRRLDNKLRRAEDRLITTRNYDRQLREVQRLEDRLRRRIARAADETDRARRVAERKVNDLARARERARQALATAEQQLVTLAATQTTP